MIDLLPFNVINYPYTVQIRTHTSVYIKLAHTAHDHPDGVLFFPLSVNVLHDSV